MTDALDDARAAVISLALAEVAEHDIEFLDKMLALADAYALEAHDAACPLCNQEYGTPESRSICPERARLGGEKGNGNG